MRILSVRWEPVVRVLAIIYGVLVAMVFCAAEISHAPHLTLPFGVLAPVFHLNFNLNIPRPDGVFSAFAAGIAALHATDPLLAEYLRHTRNWSEPLVECRNAIEHEGWALPRVIYSQKDGGLVATEPEISGQPFTAFIDYMLDRLCCFVEEFMAHSLQRSMVPEITITELPFAERSAEAPERFRLTLGTGGLAQWHITYHTSRFEET